MGAEFQGNYWIVNDRPEESWKVIAKLTKDPKSIRSWLIMKWLQGHDDVFTEQKFSAFQYLKSNDILSWIDKSKKVRSQFIARHVPKTLVPPVGTFTRDFLSRYGDDEEVRNELIANFSSEGFSGEASVHYQETKDRMIALREIEKNKNIRKFLDEYIEGLDHKIEYWRTREERED